MKTFEFRRHSIKDGTGNYMIGPAGYAFARKVGEHQLRGKDFTHFYVSGLFRTQQTLAAFAEGAGDFDTKQSPETDPVFLVSKANEDNIVLWHGVCAAAEATGEDMMFASLRYEKDRVDALADTVAQTFHAWAETMPDDANVLVVGHSPLMEFIPYGLNRTVLSGLRECSGFRIVLGGKEIQIDNQAEDLNAQTLR